MEQHPLQSDEPQDSSSQHLLQTIEWAQRNPEIYEMNESVNILISGMYQIQRIPADGLFPNSISGTACLALATRDLQAAIQLAGSGFYVQSRAMMRAAYEAATLARMLAHTGESAEKWLRRPTWIPQGEVNKWSKDGLGFSDEAQKSLGRFYGMLNEHAHPTARAALGSLIEADDGSIQFSIESRFNESILSMIYREISAVAIFACFALRNACVDEEVLHPDWRRALKEQSETVLGEAMPHLERDWEAERIEYEKLRKIGNPDAKLNEALLNNPRSWNNLKNS